MRSKEAITAREMEILLVLAVRRNQSADAIAAKLNKKIDRTGIWKILKSLTKKDLIGSTPSPLLPDERSPRGGCAVINKYFILDDAYDAIYKELKAQGKKILPVHRCDVLVEENGKMRIKEKSARVIISDPFPPNVDKRLPGEDWIDYVKRTGFGDRSLAQACKEQFTKVRKATDEEIALYRILRKCSGLAQEKEESEREYDKFSGGYWYGPCVGEEGPA
jgi:hypothetical protein